MEIDIQKICKKLKITQTKAKKYLEQKPSMKVVELEIEPKVTAFYASVAQKLSEKMKKEISAEDIMGMVISAVAESLTHCISCSECKCASKKESDCKCSKGKDKK